MSYDVIISIGQVWVHSSCPEIQYEVLEINPRGTVFVLEYVKGTCGRRCILGQVTKDGKPLGWMTGWQLISAPKMKRFSHVSPKHLRKRVREQIAGTILVGK